MSTTTFHVYESGDSITSADLNAVRSAVNKLEDLQVRIEPNESPDGARTTFTFPDSFVPDTFRLEWQGIAQGSDQFEAGPGPDQITILTDDPPITGDTLWGTYRKA